MAREGPSSVAAHAPLGVRRRRAPQRRKRRLFFVATLVFVGRARRRPAAANSREKRRATRLRRFRTWGFLSRDVFVLDLVLVLVLVLFWRVFFRHRHVRGGEFFSERVRGDAVCEKRARERVVRGG